MRNLLENGRLAAGAAGSRVCNRRPQGDSKGRDSGLAQNFTNRALIFGKRAECLLRAPKNEWEAGIFKEARNTRERRTRRGPEN